jgi:AcrR family transcriptional regulator
VIVPRSLRRGISGVSLDLGSATWSPLRPMATRKTTPQAPASAEPALRRRPRQARSQERVERILDTAEEVFAEIGYEASSTNLIAQRAGTSIGSLYEFFPNKEALAQSLAERYVTNIGKLYETLVVDLPGAEGPEIVDHIVGGLDHFYRDHPGAVPLLNGRFTSSELAAAGELLQTALTARIESIITGRRPDLPPKHCRMMAQVIAEQARSLLAFADQVPLSQRSAVVRELEKAIIGYLRETAPDLPVEPSATC